MIGSLPMRKLTGDKYLLKEMNDYGYELKLDTLTVDDFRDHTEVLCLKNFTASEVRLLYTQISSLLREIEAAQREKRLK